MRQHKRKIIAASLILIILAAAFLWGGNYAGKNGDHQEKSPGHGSLEDIGGTAGPADDSLSESSFSDSEAPIDIVDSESNAEPEEAPGNGNKQEPEKSKPLPAEPGKITQGDQAYTCTLSVRCDTILDNMKLLAPEKEKVVPADGIIFPATKVTFYQGESVFNILQREMKKNKIHMEFRNTPVYNSAYIMGINNIYEFDAGELSGWMYKVNDWFPNYGVSRYELEDGDVVEFLYSCDLGQDVGGNNITGGLR